MAQECWICPRDKACEAQKEARERECSVVREIKRVPPEKLSQMDKMTEEDVYWISLTYLAYANQRSN